MTDSPRDTLPTSPIAVVDDDPSVRQALRRLLRSAGYNVETFASSNELLRSATLEKHACLILDVQMPGLSGLELQKVVVSLRAPIPIIFITAHPDDEARQRALESGAVGFLTKPFDDQALLNLIKKAIGS